MASTGEPDDLPLAGLSVPDDPRDLEADRWAYYEELARSKDVRHTPDQPPGDHPSRWREGTPWFGFRGSRVSPLIFCIVAVLAMGASLLVALVPRTDAPAQTQALAAPTTEVGQIGGLLPTAAVGVNGAPRLLRDIRPAVLAVVPDGSCDECAAAIESAATQAADAGVRLLVTGSPEQADELADLARPLQLPVLTASASTFAPYRPAGLTLLVVAGDGTVADVVRLADADTTIDPALAGISASS